MRVRYECSISTTTCLKQRIKPGYEVSPVVSEAPTINLSLGSGTLAPVIACSSMVCAAAPSHNYILMNGRRCNLHQATIVPTGLDDPPPPPPLTADQDPSPLRYVEELGVPVVEILPTVTELFKILSVVTELFKILSVVTVVCC